MSRCWHNGFRTLFNNIDPGITEGGILQYFRPITGSIASHLLSLAAAKKSQGGKVRRTALSHTILCAPFQNLHYRRTTTVRSFLLSCYHYYILLTLLQCRCFFERFIVPKPGNPDNCARPRRSHSNVNYVTKHSFCQYNP